LKDVNEAYLQSHKKEAGAVHAVVRVRQAIVSSGDATTKEANVKALLETLENPSISLKEVEEGRKLLLEIGAEKNILQEYLEKARGRWPEATTLKA
jgi:peptide alpha-N-acetyltransferase